MATMGGSSPGRRAALLPPLRLALAAGLFLGLACDADPDARALQAPAGKRLQPEDLEYLGAFRLPAVTLADDLERLEFWSYSGYALTYCPEGDPDGPDDGFPGSLYAVGHDQCQFVAEVSIPVPLAARDLEQLNTARSLQEPSDVIGIVFGSLEIPRAGLAYLPSARPGGKGRVHCCWGQHFQQGDPSHGWFELDLEHPRLQGPWQLGGFCNYVTNDYMFAIPEEWARAHAPGKRLATGRFRDGLWGGRGPALFAYEPPPEDDPPARGARIDALTPLLLYGVQQEGAAEITTDPQQSMRGFAEADEWSGGAWLEDGACSAVVLVGTKALGRNWYGFANGEEYPTEHREDTVYPSPPAWPFDQRGWWSEAISAQMIFFDPDDLAAVAAGRARSWEPQPYATLSLDERLFDPGFHHERGKRYSLGAACFDRERGLLYVCERMVPEEQERSVIHVWRVAPR
ncbi:MAG: hypothetical protein HY812_02540 [Planctomycetes bacterium]|nr:hypothetical protein [Planctomycetota bacterium]